MSWLFLLFSKIAALPLLADYTRLQMNDKAREDAPGKFVKLRNGITHYRRFGPKTGPLVVCVHGLTTPSFVFEAIAEAFVKNGYRVLVYDHYGRGYSDRPAGLQNRAFFVQHLEELLEAMGEDGRFDLIGYSMGGWIATSYGADHPERVNRLILLAPAGIRATLGWYTLLVRYVPLIGDWVFMSTYATQHRRGTEKDRARHSYVECLVERQQRELDYRGFLPSVLSSMRGALSASTERDHRTLEEVNMNVLAIWGQNDTVIPISCKDIMASWNKDARHVVIRGADHGLTYTHVPAVMNAIDQAV